MTYKDIENVNKNLSTIDIKGKAYMEVDQRIKAFRMLYPEGSITTDMLSNDGDICVFKAVISNGEVILGTGTAFEQKGSSFINKTSYIENCETSAVGRALAMCGIGIDVSVASYEEVANAINNQDKPAKAEPKKSVAVQDAELKAKVIKYINDMKMSADKIQKICTHYKVNSLNDLSGDACRDYLDKIKAQEDKKNE